MDFGELRSRIHNDEQISWMEIKELSEREGYKEEIVPYLSSFFEYWAKAPLAPVGSFYELREFVEVAPFALFDGFFMGDRIHVMDSMVIPWRNLYSLGVRGCENVASFLRQKGYSQLKGLALDTEFLDFAGVQELTSSEDLQSLRKLWLINFSLATERMELLADSFILKEVEDLELWSASVGAQDMETLCNTPYLKKLKSFALYRNHIGFEGVRLLANSHLCENLTFLALERCQIGGDEGARHLLESPYLSKLQVLDLKRTGVSDEMLRALRERYPDADIY